MNNTYWKKRMRKTFMGITIFLLSFIGFLAQAGNAFAAADVTKPVFKGVTIDKKEVTVGDTVKVNVKAEDMESGVKNITIWYEAPATEKYTLLYLSYNSSTQQFEGDFHINADTESGTWKIIRLDVTDNANNTLSLTDYNSNVQRNPDLKPGDFTVSGTHADITKPTFQYVKVSNNDVTEGNTVKVSVKAEDTESGVKNITIWYEAPATEKYTLLYLSYNSSTQQFEGDFHINADTESGTWKIIRLDVTDNANNTLSLTDYNSNVQRNPDLKPGDFTVSGTHADITKPTFQYVKVSNNDVTEGNTVKVSVKAEDMESGVKNITIWYEAPITKKYTLLYLSYNSSTQQFEGTLDITDETELGVWKIIRLDVTDNANNTLTLTDYNSNVQRNPNLKPGDFTVKEDPNPIQPLPQKVVKTATTWTNQTIEGDLYIAPNSTLTVNGNVTVNGDIYVLGSILNYGNLTVNGTIHARQFLWGRYSTSNGNVSLLGGTNSIRGMTASNRVLEDIPFSIYTQPLIAKDGKISFEGATLPIVNMAIEGQPIKLNYNGTFKVDDLDIGDKNSLTVTFTDVFFNTITKEVPVQILDTIAPTASTNIKGGYYSTGKQVALTMSEKGSIYYTLDGSEPTTASHVYEQPIPINQNTVLKYIAIDKAGNKSNVYKEEYAFFSVNEVTDQSKAVTGKAKPDSTITVRIGTQEWKTTAGKDGLFTVAIPAQTGGQTVAVFAKDTNGLQSDTVEMTVKDITAPEAPKVNVVTDQSTEVTGTTEANANVAITANGKTIASATANSNGTFTIKIPKQTAGTELLVTATDKANNVSKQTKIIVQDVTAPNKPEVNAVSDEATTVTGKAEAGATVTIYANGKQLSSATADSNGAFTISIPVQKTGTELVVTATDKAGNKSEEAKVTVKDMRAPNKPEVHAVTDKATQVTGKTEPNAAVSIFVNTTQIGSVAADKDGNFTVQIPAQKGETVLTIIAADKAGNKSEPATVIVTDTTAPNKPKVDPVTDKTTQVTGKAEPFANVILSMNNGNTVYMITADENGNFTVVIDPQKGGTELVVTVSDKAGNTSEQTKVTVQDITPPEKPKMSEITTLTKKVTGTAEPFAKVTILANNAEIRSATTDANGNVAMDIPAQKAGTELTIIATDQAGNKSEPVKITVKQGYTGWTKINNNWYYYKPETGIAQTDWGFINNQWYFFNKEGIMQTNWKQINGTWYFFNTSGAMQTGWNQVNGAWYFLNQSGAMQTGWTQIGGTWYFLNQSGTMQTGWAQIGGVWYFLNQSGAMQTGWTQIGGVWYLFNTSGTMQTGWTVNNGTWYFLNRGGAMQTGWQQINGTWYYFYNDGRMAANTTIGGYKLGANGALA